MKKKHLNIVLLVLLIIIWGGVIYKYFGKTTIASNTSQRDVNSLVYTLKVKTDKDTFQLKLTNKNPFKTTKQSNSTYAKTKVTSQPLNRTKLKANKVLKWPTITYHGFVKGNRNNTRLILLKINNKLYRKREKETVNEVRLIKAFNDSLEVSFQNNIKYIKKIHG